MYYKVNNSLCENPEAVKIAVESYLKDNEQIIITPLKFQIGDKVKFTSVVSKRNSYIAIIRWAEVVNITIDNKGKISYLLDRGIKQVWLPESILSKI